MIYDLSKDYEISRFKARCEQMISKAAKVDLIERRPKRTLRQNNYLHCCIALFAVEIGNTIQEMKTDLKRDCSFMIYEKNGNKYLRSSTDLSTKEMSDWIEWIRTRAGLIGIYIPNADEYMRNWAELEKQIESHKQYL
jgi:hypothetical protein